MGVYLHPSGVGVVAVEERQGLPFVRGTRWVALEPNDERPLKERHKTALRQALEEMAFWSENCVLSTPPTQVVTVRFNVPEKAREKDIQSAAVLHATSQCEWPEDDRYMALDPLPDTGDRLMSISRKETIDLLIEVAQDAGLTPIGIDVPLAAWQRAMHDHCDAILDTTYQRPALYIFAEPIGEQHLLIANLTPERLAAAVRTKFVEARRNQFADVRKLQIVAPQCENPNTCKASADATQKCAKCQDVDRLVEALRQDVGLEVALLQFGAAQNPPWAFAGALATWSFVDGGNA